MSKISNNSLYNNIVRYYKIYKLEDIDDVYVHLNILLKEKLCVSIVYNNYWNRLSFVDDIIIENVEDIHKVVNVKKKNIFKATIQNIGYKRYIAVDNINVTIYHYYKGKNNTSIKFKTRRPIEILSKISLKNVYVSFYE